MHLFTYQPPTSVRFACPEQKSGAARTLRVRLAALLCTLRLVPKTQPLFAAKSVNPRSAPGLM
jgi:hypothetical protein